jgi:hypothetical protein
LIAFLSKLDLKHVWAVEIKRYRKTRTNPQLALYWKWLTIVSDETGNDRDDLHEILKSKFLEPKVIALGGETHVRFTTSGLSAGDMSAYMDRVCAFVTGELGIFLPAPEDVGDRRVS